ncbi:MAG TPA: hypothetical protein VG433_05740, partial [Pirellulales bacterium]|nr:hypothetical protein [Pirellulales bacterium]
ASFPQNRATEQKCKRFEQKVTKDTKKDRQNQSTDAALCETEQKSKRFEQKVAKDTKKDRQNQSTDTVLCVP